MRPDLAVALDLPSAREALRLVDAAGPAGTWYKVGPVLYVREGPAIVRELLVRGKSVFLDLKWHDIPNTVAGAVAAAADLGVHLATVHLAGGPAMLEAAARARGAALKLAGVGVLTSLDAAGYGAVVGRAVATTLAEQQRLAALVVEAGLDAMVCSASEVPAVRAAIGADRMVVVPGIRRSGEAVGDQARAAAPGEAVRAGADLLVVGRPITAAADPALALAEFRRDLAA